MIDLIREIAQTLNHNKLRTCLTGLAVAWGIFMLIVLLGMGNGVTNSFREHALTPDSQKISVWGGRTSKPFHGYREGRYISLKTYDIDKVTSKHHDFVSEVTSELYGSSTTFTAGTNSMKTNYVGVFPSRISGDRNIEVVEGRLLNDNDMGTSAKVIVIPERNAKLLFPAGDALGKYVSIGGLAFKIVGIYRNEWRRDSYIPYSTARMLAGNSDNVGNMNVMLKNVKDEADGDHAETEIRRTLASSHDFAPDDESAVWLWNQFSQGMRGLAAMSILNISIWVLGLLTLLSGVVGISNIMFVSVKERTHEIGIRRAIGAKPSSILSQVIAESVAITTLFGYIGIVLGTLATGVLNAIFGDTDFISNPTVSLSVAFQVTVVLIAAGALAGLFPALKALKVKPVEALRDE